MKNFKRLPAAFFGLLFWVEIAGCGGAGAGENPPKNGPSDGPAKPDGLAVFRQNCTNCHGIDGKLGLNGAKDLSQSKLTADERTLVITNGRNAMTPWKDALSTDEIRAVAEFTCSLK